MKTLACLFSILIASFCFNLNGYLQELTTKQKEIITSEITAVFEKSIQAAENFDAKMLADHVDDSMQAGFIINGHFFRSFNQVMGDFNEKIKRAESQKMIVANKKITVLADKSKTTAKWMQNTNKYM